MQVAIIGGGVAGCAAAFQLRRAGCNVVLFEQGPVLGGRAMSWRENGAVVDSGAGFFTNFYPTLLGLLREFGMLDQVLELDRRTVFVKDGQAAPLALGSLRSFATYRWLGWQEKLRMAAQTVAVTARFRGLNLGDPKSLAAVDDETVADDARRRLGDGVYQHVVRPGIEPFWYFSCDEASRALYLALHARAADARFFALRGGMDDVCRWLTEGIEQRTECSATQLRQSGRHVYVDGVGDTGPFDAVVVATPAPAAAQLCQHLECVTASQLAILKQVRYVANIHACYRVATADALGDATAAFPVGPGSHEVAAVSRNRGKGQGEGRSNDGELISVYLSADASERLLDASHNEVYARAWQSAQAFWNGLPNNAEPFRLAMRRQAIPIHEVGGYRRAARFARQQTAPVVFAGDYLATATVEGALRSGFAAAEALTPHLHRSSRLQGKGVQWLRRRFATVTGRT